MSTHDLPRVFRAAPWLVVVVVLALAAFVGFAWLAYRAQGPSLTALALLGMSVIAMIGLVDTMTTRVVLHPDAIEILAVFRRRRIERADIERVVAEKGVPISLALRVGGWAKLPDLGGSLHPNTLRAWLKRNASQPVHTEESS